MSAQSTIAKQREVIAELSKVVKSLRAENPEVAAMYDERELLKELLRIREEELTKAATLGDALVGLLKSTGSNVFEQPVAKSGTGEVVAVLPKGRGTWAPSTPEQAKAERERLAKSRQEISEFGRTR